jgi:hypothetical protein
VLPTIVCIILESSVSFCGRLRATGIAAAARERCRIGAEYGRLSVRGGPHAATKHAGITAQAAHARISGALQLVARPAVPAVSRSATSRLLDASNYRE